MSDTALVLSPLALASRREPGVVSPEAAFGGDADAVRVVYAEVERALPWIRRPPQQWLRLARNLPHNRIGLAVLRRAKARAKVEGAPLRPGAIEQYVLLQAILAVAPRLATLPVDPAVKRLYLQLAAEIAHPPAHLAPMLDCNRWEFCEVSQILTLRRFPAGQHNWVVGAAGRSALFRFRFRLRLREYPRLLREVYQGFGGMTPVASIHLTNWRGKPDIVLKSESCRSLYRIAKSMELQPRIRGIQGISWLHSKDVATVSPHLAWMRDLFVDNGAFSAELEPADPKMYLVGSAKRRQLHDAQKFSPRLTMVLWRRADVLGWASAHPEFGDPAL